MKFYRWVCSNDGLYKIGDTFEYGVVNSQYYERVRENSKSFINSSTGTSVTFIDFEKDIKSKVSLDVAVQVEKIKKKKESNLEREIIFERVRRDYYNEKPSRMRCAFACSSEAIALTWKSDLSLGDATYVQLVELEAIGDVNFAECDDQYLYTNESMDSSEIEKMAHKYWSGKGNNRKELLLEGRFGITKIIKHN